MHKWFVEFKQDRYNTIDETRLVCAKTSTTDEQIDAIHSAAFDEKCLTA